MSASSSGSGLSSGSLAPPSPALGRFPNSKGAGLGLGIPASPGAISAGSGVVAGAGGIVDEEIDPDEPLPTFEVQPAMLAVDLSLMPGESRSCGCFCVFYVIYSTYR
jgi:RAB6A-GEF complex partner protein 2